MMRSMLRRRLLKKSHPAIPHPEKSTLTLLVEVICHLIVSNSCETMGVEKSGIEWANKKAFMLTKTPYNMKTPETRELMDAASRLLSVVYGPFPGFRPKPVRP